MSEDGDTLLTVQEFAFQPEIDKHPSQLYGWMKKGLPVVIQDGKKYIPFKAGLAWIHGREGKIREEKSEQTKLRSDLQPGVWLCWDRGNNLGPAYGLLQHFTNGLAVISVEYRTVPVYFSRADLERDLKFGRVRFVHPTEVAAFLLHEVARLDFLAHMVAGPEKARALKDAVLAAEILPPDFVERFKENRYRPAKLWPADEELIEGGEK